MGNDTEALIINDDVSRVIWVIFVTDSMFWMNRLNRFFIFFETQITIMAKIF